MEILTDHFGNEIVFIENADGTTLSMSKAHYEELEAAKANANEL